METISRVEGTGVGVMSMLKNSLPSTELVTISKLDATAVGMGTIESMLIKSPLPPSTELVIISKLKATELGDGEGVAVIMGTLCLEKVLTEEEQSSVRK